MRILKYGRMDRYNCGRCGCEFEAGKNESRWRYDTHDRVAWCPCCGAGVVMAEGDPQPPMEDDDDD